ncbi:MAG: MATE family efflux transporter [Streptococcaceae bacterium]|jgi:putative MATE family efflux protein|nr:MATE family efflux transporter [Streptococcaceae bacterium]
MTKIHERGFWQQVLHLAIPVALQGILLSFLTIVNQIMVGKEGPAAVVAVGLASKNAGVLGFIMMGLTGGLAILSAQLVGAGQRDKIAKHQGMMLFVGLGISLLFVLISLFAANWSMHLFTNDPAVIEIGIQYHQLLALSYLPNLFIGVYSTVLRADGIVKFPMLVSMVAVPLNVFLNYLLIFGNLGAPRLGAAGSALATTLATSLEAIILLTVIYVKKLTGSFSLRELLSFLKFDDEIKQLWRLSLPLLGDNLSFILADTVSGAVYGFLGTSQTVAVTLMMPIQLLIITFFSGFGTAGSVMVGHALGRDAKDQAYQTSKKILYLSTFASLGIGGLLLIVMNWYLPLFHLSSYSLQLTWLVMFLMVAFIPSKVYNMVVGSILAAGGETKFLLYMSLLGAWVFSVPLGYLTAFALHWPIYMVFTAITFEEMIRMGLGIWKFKSKTWLNNLVKEAT